VAKKQFPWRASEKIEKSAKSISVTSRHLREPSEYYPKNRVKRGLQRLLSAITENHWLLSSYNFQGFHLQLIQFQQETTTQKELLLLPKRKGTPLIIGGNTFI